MNLPYHNDLYNKKTYWETRYQDEDEYDWLVSYSGIKELIDNQVKKDDKILMLGCGNSVVSEEMYNEGYEDIVNLDYSEEVIKNMRQKYSDLDKMEWVTMDATEMTFPDATFDVIIEKCTFEAFTAEEKDPWHMSEKCENRIDAVLSKASKMLKKGGRFISISFTQPHFRRPLYARHKYDWSVDVQTFGDMFHYFFYTLIKGGTLSDSDQELEKRTLAKKDSAVCSDLHRLTLDYDDDENYLLNISCSP